MDAKATAVTPRRADEDDTRPTVAPQDLPISTFNTLEAAVKCAHQDGNIGPKDIDYIDGIGYRVEPRRPRQPTRFRMWQIRRQKMGLEEKEARTDAARRAVLETYELLEMILVELDTKTLLFGQRVCKAWKSIIGRSDLLQQALFFKLAKKDGRPFGVNGINPLLMRHTHIYVDPRSPDHDIAEPKKRAWCYFDFAPEDRHLRVTGISDTAYELQLNFEALYGWGEVDGRYFEDGRNGTRHLSDSGSMLRMYPMQTPYTWCEDFAAVEPERMNMDELLTACCECEGFERAKGRDENSRFCRLSGPAAERRPMEREERWRQELRELGYNEQEIEEMVEDP